MTIWSQELAAPPDLSTISTQDDRAKAWLNYCSALAGAKKGIKENLPGLKDAGLKGLQLSNNKNYQCIFYWYTGVGYYYQIKFDSAQYYLYQSLSKAVEINAPERITKACVTLIPVNFQLQQLDKTDSIKNLLQSIADTSLNNSILMDAYAGLGNYWNFKSYYGLAQENLFKSIQLRKLRVDTTSNAKEVADYAITCYLLSELYQKTMLYQKSLEILKEGAPYALQSKVVAIRYLSSYVEVYSQLGNIDSALFYVHKLKDAIVGLPNITSEEVSADINIARYYLDKQQPELAAQWIEDGSILANESKSPLLIYQMQILEGSYKLMKKQYREAITSFNAALPMAYKTQREDYANAVKGLAEAYADIDDAENAMKYYKEYAMQLDTISKERSERNFAEMEARFQNEQKKHTINTLNLENSKQLLQIERSKRNSYILAAGLMFIGLISLFLYITYINKARTNHLLNQKNDALETANNTKAKLFGIISHDLRAPVANISRALKNIRENPDDVATVQKDTGNLLETMEDLLIWSKSQMENFNPVNEKVSLLYITEEVISFFQPNIREKGISILQKITQEDFVITDEDFLKIILRNLLQNAVKCCPSHSSITINWLSDNNELIIENEAIDIDVQKLNDHLQHKAIASASSGLGLQLVAELSSRIGTTVHFSQKNSNSVSAHILFLS